MPEVRIIPENTILSAEDGANLKEVLEANGFQFPNNCGGKGKCLNCRVEYHSTAPQLTTLESRYIDGNSPIRLSCLHKLEDDICISVPVISEITMSKHLGNFDFESDIQGIGIAVDIGTTTVAVYLIDHTQRMILDQDSFINPQLTLGGDVMSRLCAARDPGKLACLSASIYEKTAKSISLLANRNETDISTIRKCTIAGNTAMTHFWLGDGGGDLGVYPFKSHLQNLSELEFSPDAVNLSTDCICQVSPIISGFIGGDILCGIIGLDLDLTAKNVLMIDFGTNGEIVLSTKGKVYATSTAAGPAFEGVGMYSGMAAGRGAVTAINNDGSLCVIGNDRPVGFCGSGYVSAIAYLLKNSIMIPSGLLEKDNTAQRRWSPVKQTPPWIMQDDIRKFQLAKGAIAGGIEILLKNAGLKSNQLDQIILTGSFGVSINPAEAIETGLLPHLDLQKVNFITNAAGRGVVKYGAHSKCRERALRTIDKTNVINLVDHPDFEEVFVSNMTFPENRSS